MRRRDGVVVGGFELHLHLFTDGAEALLTGREGLLVNVVGHYLLARERRAESDLRAQDACTKYCYVVECHARHVTPADVTSTSVLW